MTDRERLIELIGQVQYLGGLELALADHLIANGVKIPVLCKDCKRNNMNGGDCNRIMTMYHYDHVLELNVAEYIKLEHCSYGERKENG